MSGKQMRNIGCYGIFISVKTRINIDKTKGINEKGSLFKTLNK